MVTLGAAAAGIMIAAGDWRNAVGLAIAWALLIVVTEGV